jgi:NADH-quinone oxidoreductase subunit J
MDLLFYVTAFVAVISTVMVITRLNAVHALLYLVVSLLSVAFLFYLMGAPFVAALEIIIYAGAIMVLFIFVVMMLNLGKQSTEKEGTWLHPKMWIGPAVCALILITELFYILLAGGLGSWSKIHETAPQEIGRNLFGPYLLGVELAALLLLAGLVGAYHLGHRRKKVLHRFLQEDSR